jgi:hypothetical protein
MNFPQLTTTNKQRFQYIALAFVFVWFIANLVAYIPLAGNPGILNLSQIFGLLYHFYLWQAAAFLVVTLITAFVRPAALGGICIAFLALSSAALLRKSHDAIFIAKFCVFLFWFVSTVNTSRMAVLRLAGPRFASWGLSAAFVFAAMVPIGFFLGLIGAIALLPIAILAVLAALPGFCGGVRFLSRRSHGGLSAHGSILQSLRQLDFADVFLLEVIWLILAITFIGASGVETFSDAARVHLPYAHQVIKDHGISHQFPCILRLQLMAAETCFAMCALIGTDAAAKWFLWFSLGTIAMLVAEECYRRSNSLRTGLFAGAITLSCPIMNIFSTTLYIDVFITMLCTAGFIVLFRSLRPVSMRGILFSAFIMSSAVQTKYTGLIFCAVWGAILFCALLALCPWRAAVQKCVIAGLFLLAAGCPWYIYIYHGTGNPFYPFLNNWFPSPYWMDGLTFKQFFDEHFKMSPGIWGVVSYLWEATYETARYIEGRDGFFGFALIALAPCLLLARYRRSLLYWDMIIAGVAMAGGVIMYTPYIRYWMPAYPLLVGGCALAFCALLEPLERFWKGLTGSMSVCLVSAATVILPVTFLCVQMPWDEYTKTISRDERIGQQYNGYQVIKEFNAMLEPEDGVLCIGYEGIHLLGGRPYEFFFLTETALKIDSLDAFVEFYKKYNMRYFFVSYSIFRMDKNDIIHRIMARYCNDRNLVMGAGMTAVYKIQESPESTRPETIISRTLPSLVETLKQWSPKVRSDNWINQYAENNPKCDGGQIHTEGQGHLTRRLNPDENAGACRVQCNFHAEKVCSPVMRCVWYGEAGQELTFTIVFKQDESDPSLWLYVPSAPEGAASCWLYCWEWNGKPMLMKDCTITWINVPDVTYVAKRHSSEKK